MDQKFGRHFIPQEADAVVCRNYKRTGRILWDQLSRVPGSHTDLIGIDGSFFERLSKTPPYPIELVCRYCGGVAMIAYPSTSLCSKEKYN